MSVFDKLEPKNKWEDKLETDVSINVPDNLSDRQFINYIITNIIKQECLLGTHYIQNIIRALHEGYLNIGSPTNFTRQDAVKILENYVNHKVFCEQIRSGQVKLSDSFLNY